MPSLIDPDLAPEGKHVLHAYVPATEPYEWWADMDRSSDEYMKKKEEAADFLWSAIEEYVPNARDRAVKGTVQIGTPLTHERFLRRNSGAYGPRVEAGKQTLPGHTTPLDGLLLCGGKINNSYNEYNQLFVAFLTQVLYVASNLLQLPNRLHFPRYWSSSNCCLWCNHSK